MSLFVQQPTVERMLVGLTTITYNDELLRHTLQADVDELSDDKSLQHSMSVCDATALMLPSSPSGDTRLALMQDQYLTEHNGANALNARTNIQQFLHNVVQVNQTLFISDCQYMMTHSWRMFVEVCLHKDAELLGVGSSSFSWQYIQQLV